LLQACVLADVAIVVNTEPSSIATAFVPSRGTPLTDSPTCEVAETITFRWES
jgi:hypothetical protein